jgi:pyocin large subunit-like protein
MSRAFRSFFFALVCLVAGTWLLCAPREEPSAVGAEVPPAASAPVATAPAVPAAPPRSTSTIGFRTRDRLLDHYAKHGAEFKAASPEAYLVLAQTLRAAPPGGEVREIVRPTDGVISKFDRRTGAFVAFDADSIIRTFFKPNDGEAYFERQARRRPQN